MKALYTPFGILFGVIGGLIGGQIFKQVWKLVAGEEDAPSARQSEYGWKEVLPAAAAQGAIFAVVKAALDRKGAQDFQKVTGVWPGD
jgi:xanthosine utilization system XapX-like protein